MTKQGQSEDILYQNIVGIPHYHTQWLTILDKEDIKEVVQDNLDRFQEMYRPIWQAEFKDCFSLESGKFEIDQSNTASRKYLMR